MTLPAVVRAKNTFSPSENLNCLILDDDVTYCISCFYVNKLYNFRPDKLATSAKALFRGCASTKVTFNMIGFVSFLSGSINKSEPEKVTHRSLLSANDAT